MISSRRHSYRTQIRSIEDLHIGDFVKVRPKYYFLNQPESTLYGGFGFSEPMYAMCGQFCRIRFIDINSEHPYFSVFGITYSFTVEMIEPELYTLEEVNKEVF